MGAAGAHPGAVGEREADLLGAQHGGEEHAGQLSVVEAGAGQGGDGKVEAAEIGVAQVGPAQVVAPEVRLTQIQHPQVGRLSERTQFLPLPFGLPCTPCPAAVPVGTSF